jgi:uncharacterized protein YwbE
MTKALRLGKKAFTVSVVVTTIAWSIGLAAFLAPLTAQAAVASGDLIKASLPAVYYYGADGKRYVFPNEKTYKTWFSDFSSVKKITDDELAAITIGGNVTYKPGVKMVKITTDPKTYAVQKGGVLRWVKTEAVAIALYGSNWNTKIEDISDAFFTNYTIGAEVASSSDFDVAGQQTLATSINADKGLVTGGGTGGGLTVALSSGTPVTNSVLTDSTNLDGQALAPFTKLTFSASTAGSVTVRTVKLHRTGISTDTDFSNVYLYDGNTRVGDSASFSSGVVTINDASGLFTVPAGGSKEITVKADMTNAASGVSIAGKTFRFGIDAATDITSDASSVNGAFPVTGNFMTGATITDLASFTINTATTFPATIDPGVTDRELWRFNMVGSNWDVAVEYLRLTVVGTIAVGDITNIKLEVAGVQIGNTVSSLNASKEAIFDMTSNPYIITAGQTKTVIVKGDVVGGTNRAFKFTFQKMADAVAMDKNYGVYLKPNQADSFTLIEPETGDGTNINTGTLTITKASDSPSGYITKGLTNAVLARFNFKANGEAVKLTSLGIGTNFTTDDSSDLNNGKLYLDGVQVGTTTDLNTDATLDGAQSTWSSGDTAATNDDTNFTFGNSFIIPAGTTKVLEVRADLTHGDGSAITANSVITVYLNTGAQGSTTAEGTTAVANGQGMVSMSSITSSASNGNPLTVNTGTVTTTINPGLADKSASSPSGVEGGKSVKVGSFVIAAGSGEGIDVAQISISDYAYPANDNLQNLKLMHEGTQIGLTKGTLNSASGTYAFSPSPALSIAAGTQYVVDLYADVLTDATYNDIVHTPFSLAIDSITATGKVSGLSANGPATALVLQANYYATGGALRATVAADSPVAGQLAMGETDVTMGKFRLSASSTEAARITQLSITDDMSNYYVDAATGALRNIRLYDGSTLLGTVSSFISVASNTAYATFTSLNLEIPKGGSKTLTVKADVTPYDGFSITSTRHRMVIKQDYLQKYGEAENLATGIIATDNTIQAWGLDSGTQLVNDFLNYGNLGNTEHDAIANPFDVFKSKISVAKASDAPSGVHAASTEDTVAKFTVSNVSPGGFSARVREMNFDISASGFSMETETLVKVYKSSSYSTDNRLASSDMCDASGCVATNPFDTNFGAASFTDLDIAAGSSQTIWVTLNTSSAALESTDTETLSVGIAAGMITWDEDADDSTTDAYSEVTSLPITGNTLTY